MRKTQSRHARSAPSVDDHRGAASRSARVLATTPVKGTALHFPDSLHLGPRGAQANRSFYLVDRHGALVNGKRHGPLVRLRAEYSPERNWLSLRFPDGAVVAGDVSARDARVETSFYGRPVTGRVVAGPWAEALSAYVGMPVALVAPEQPGDAVDVHPVTIVSTASIDALGRSTAERTIDRRRFRMLIEVGGCDAYEEDTWIGATVRIGTAHVHVVGPVPRCVVTTHDPDRGVRDLPTLRLLLEQRGARTGAALATPVDHLPDAGKACFGVYGTVEAPGEVRVGDAVTVLPREDAA